MWNSKSQRVKILSRNLQFLCHLRCELFYWPKTIFRNVDDVAISADENEHASTFEDGESESFEIYEVVDSDNLS